MTNLGKVAGLGALSRAASGLRKMVGDGWARGTMPYAAGGRAGATVAMSLLGSMTIVKEEGYADHYYDNAYESDLHLGHDSALASHLQGLYQVGAACHKVRGPAGLSCGSRLAETLMT